jgi:hypothetical protein
MLVRSTQKRVWARHVDEKDQAWIGDVSKKIFASVAARNLA